MKRLFFSWTLLIFAYFSACNSDMIGKGIQSLMDPRVPDINVKQGADNIPSGGSFGPISGVKAGDSSAEISFIIENIGTADLNLSGATPVMISGANAGEFQISRQPSESTILPGRNTTFSLTFNPAAVGDKTAFVTIKNNDFDEGDYSFTMNATTKPGPDFSARLRKGVIPMTVNFEDRSIGEVTSYAWDFDGDGIVDSTLKNGTFTYHKSGTYSVVLTVTGPGGENYCIKSGYITTVEPERHTIDENFTGIVNTGDIDGDGKIDILGLYDDGVGGGHEQAWWWNSGVGYFIKNTLSPTRLYATAIFAVNIDNDGMLDIVTGGYDGIAWWQNGNWSTRNDIYTGSGFASIYPAYIDNNTTIDIIGVGYDGLNSHDLVFWWQNNNGSFSIHPAIENNYVSNLYSVSAADLVGDTYAYGLDVITVQGTIISWWQNASNDGTSWTKNTLTTDFTSGGSIKVTSADLNGDGYNDILAASSADNEIAWWKNNGDLTFGSQQTISSDVYGASNVYTDDMNGDGHMDILGTAENFDAVLWWQNDGSANPSFTEYTIDSSFEHPISVCSADLNGDGKKDVIAGSTKQGISWWEINQSVWDSHTIEPYLNLGSIVRIADIDKDNKIDFIFRNDPSEIFWRRNQGNNQPGDKQIIEDTLSTDGQMYLVDIDNDGFTDIAATDTPNETIYWWRNENGSGFGDSAVIKNITGLTRFFPADLDNDNDTDIIIIDYNLHNRISWLENDGSGNFSDEIFIYDDTSDYIGNARALYAEDLDNDTFKEVIVADSNKNQVAWFKNNGDKTFGDINTFAASNSPSALFAAYIDNDGNMDILTGWGDGVSWYKNMGNGTFASAQNIATGTNGMNNVYAADIDGDSRNDVIITHSGTTLVWYKNENDSGSSWTANIISRESGANPGSVSTYDFDGDGDLDILSIYKNGAVWWENNIKDYGTGN